MMNLWYNIKKKLKNKLQLIFFFNNKKKVYRPRGRQKKVNPVHIRVQVKENQKPSVVVIALYLIIITLLIIEHPVSQAHFDLYI